MRSTLVLLLLMSMSTTIASRHRLYAGRRSGDPGRCICTSCLRSAKARSHLCTCRHASSVVSTSLESPLISTPYLTFVRTRSGGSATVLSIMSILDMSIGCKHESDVGVGGGAYACEGVVAVCGRPLGWWKGR